MIRALNFCVPSNIAFCSSVKKVKNEPVLRDKYPVPYSDPYFFNNCETRFMNSEQTCIYRANQQKTNLYFMGPNGVKETIEFLFCGPGQYYMKTEKPKGTIMESQSREENKTRKNIVLDKINAYKTVSRFDFSDLSGEDGQQVVAMCSNNPDEQEYYIASYYPVQGNHIIKKFARLNDGQTLKDVAQEMIKNTDRIAAFSIYGVRN